MLKYVIPAILVVVLMLCIGAYLVFGQDLGFYLGLYRAHRAGQRFYTEYEHLARDVAFHPDMDPRMDIYSPPSGTGYPVLVFVHGGGWKDYDKELFAPVAIKMLPKDIVVVIPDYTLHPDAGYEQMAHEVTAALVWTLENIEQYGGDPRRVVVAGHSAGGHLAGLAIMDPCFLQAYGHTNAEICGLIGLSGVYDVQGEFDYWQAKGAPPGVMTEVMGGQENFAQASPITYTRPDMPPVLLIHGEDDETVPLSIATDFDAALKAVGVPSTLKVYNEAGHSDYLFAALSADDSPIVTDIAGFVQGCAPARH